MHSSEGPIITPKTGLLVRVKTACLELGQSYEQSAGVGTDDYSEPPMAHAMADGKYLRALVSLRRAEIISKAHFKRTATAAVERLIRCAVPGYGGGIAWGLNFARNDIPADEAYLITTSLVLRGVLDLQRCTDFDMGQDQLIVDGSRSMITWPRILHEYLPVPIYSANIKRPIYNAALQWLAFLAEAGLEKAAGIDREPYLQFFRKLYLPCYGWAYEPGSSRVDLLHCCYNLSALASLTSVQEWEGPLLQIATGFRQDGGYVDAFDRLDWDVALTRSSARNVRFSNGFAMLQLPKAARAWSMGELLVCLVATVRPDTAVIRALARDVAEHIIDCIRPGDTSGPLHKEGKLLVRHAMHVLHGLSEFLRAERAASLR